MADQQNEEDKKVKRVPYHFGEKLRAVRERKGYTLKTVAEKAGRVDIGRGRIILNRRIRLRFSLKTHQLSKTTRRFRERKRWEVYHYTE